ncbi:hypothetical protein N0V94_001861 [Neodidymelliopsis sp. IMI 364377]|nr:hypothetical protein N0V94_001861 [Neodidymelliopsis sp. IMI 364377]
MVCINLRRHRSPKPRTVSFVGDSKPSLPTPTDLPTSYDFSEGRRPSTKLVDIDGMNIMFDVRISSASDLDIDLEPVEEIPTQHTKEIQVRRPPVEISDWEDNPATASWGPLMQEFFGDSWRCPSPTILHIGAPDSSNPSSSTTVCPIWKKSNELFEKIYTSISAPGTQSLTLSRKQQQQQLSAAQEAGLLYLGIKQDWANMSDEWMQSPALVILKQVDEFLFCHLPKVERLATAYKSLKLMKVRLLVR